MQGPFYLAAPLVDVVARSIVPRAGRLVEGGAEAGPAVIRLHPHVADAIRDMRECDADVIVLSFDLPAGTARPDVSGLAARVDGFVEIGGNMRRDDLSAYLGIDVERSIVVETVHVLHAMSTPDPDGTRIEPYGSWCVGHVLDALPYDPALDVVVSAGSDVAALLSHVVDFAVLREDPVDGSWSLQQGDPQRDLGRLAKAALDPVPLDHEVQSPAPGLR